MAAAQAQQAENEAAYAADAAKAQAEKIRRLGRAQRGETNAALAAAGVKLGEGTALELEKDVLQKSEEDALSAILSGKRAMQAGDAEASMLRTSGKNAQTAGYMSAASTALMAGGMYAKGGWKASATTGTGATTTPGYSSGDLGSGVRR